jgi:anti-sigma B factor antagonist
MELSLQSQKIDDAVVIRCQGRIVVGAEIAALQQELEKHTVLTKKVILHLGEVTFIDSVGLGALVRQFGMLRAKGGDLKLCQVSPFLLQVLQVTNLLRVFPIHASEEEAIQAFSKGKQFQEETFGASKTRIVCIDPSHDLLAYVSALLKRSGYEVITTRNPSDALLFIRVTKPHILICGPGMHANETAMKGFAELKPSVHLLHLPSDFSTGEAGQAGTNLVNRVRQLLSDQQGSTGRGSPS